MNKRQKKKFKYKFYCKKYHYYAILRLYDKKVAVLVDNCYPDKMKLRKVRKLV